MTPIPRIIHQLYFPDESAVPSRYIACRRSVLSHHPDWDHRFWTEAAARDFLAAEYPDFLPIFDGYPHRIQRCDAIRFFLLHHYGGFYVDMDVEFLRPLDDLLEDTELVLSRRMCIGNAVMGSTKGHPLWPVIIATMRERTRRPPLRRGHLRESTMMWYVSRSTGSELVDDCVRGEGYDRSPTVRVLPGHVLEGDPRWEVDNRKQPWPGLEDIHALHHHGMRGLSTPRRLLAQSTSRALQQVIWAKIKLRDRAAARG